MSTPISAITSWALIVPAPCTASSPGPHPAVSPGRILGRAIGRYPAFIEYAAGHAAIEVSRSSSRVRPPDNAMNAAASLSQKVRRARFASQA
jgi:hypothetical protein